MPLYEYRCRKCKGVFERIRKFSDPPLIKCEVCGGKLERLPSAPAIRFKGSGWYVTDYAPKSGTTETSKSDGSSESSGKKAGESAGDTKKAAETPTAKESKPSKPAVKK